MLNRPHQRVVNVPKSTIDKWIFYDREFTPQQICKALDIAPHQLKFYMEEPWKYFTILQMEKLAFLLDKEYVDVHWACFKRPLEKTLTDLSRLQLIKALERSGIR